MSKAQMRFQGGEISLALFQIHCPTCHGIEGKSKRWKSWIIIIIVGIAQIYSPKIFIIKYRWIQIFRNQNKTIGSVIDVDLLQIHSKFNLSSIAPFSDQRR